MNDSTSWMMTAGGIAALLALLAWIGDRRRMRRRDMDRVGFMPWTPIFFWSLLAAVLLLGLGGRALLGG
ncbi:LPXTG cell wall anchor domain-containing protein [Novosphingobium naphthalenivorans]|uniref:LPXTG cell wall anchor domain-containing protein n=1 Tax=Novosphingobium naphthalenivorans TaxID=273168 RepID=UPI0008332075|nr:LPXTG cell wall anchor domain-containing protein [Novosphingobium naphthalenivorans]